jgi:hypothetical protein
LRREGRRKRKAGAKNEKAILDYSLFLSEVKKKFHKYQRKILLSRLCCNDSKAVTTPRRSFKTGVKPPLDFKEYLAPIHKPQKQPFEHQGSERQNKRLEKLGILNNADDEKPSDCVEVGNALQDEYGNGICADDDKEKRPLLIAPDINQPVEQSQQQ